MPTIDLDGATFYFEERGAGRPVLLIHGTGGHTGTLEPLAERLASTHRVLCYDRRGYGRTGGALPGRGYLGRHTADAAALLNALGAANAIVVGWSWGGLVALSLAIDQPDLVERLVLYEPPLHARKHMNLGMASAIGGAILLGKLGLHRRAARRFYDFVLRRSDGTNSFDAVTPAMRESVLAGSRTIVRELEAGTGEQLTPAALGRIRCPVGVVVGGQSAPMLVDASQRVRELVPSATLVRVAGGDHVMNVLMPDALASAIRECLSA